MARAEVPLLAVLIDADNVLARHAESILKEITSFGEPGLRRVYGDWSNPQLREWKGKARDLGLVTHQETANTTGKNASDIGLVIDAMDILHTGKFDGFVLVSSDSDFTRLASRIREDGLEVIGIGEAKTPAALRNVCNRFILIENLSDDAEAAAPERSVEPRESRPAADKAKQDAAPKKEPPSKAIPIIRNAMNAIDRDGEWYSLGVLGQFITQAHPDFDSRTYGSAKLSDLLRKTGRFEVKQGDGKHLIVRDLA
jgi:hypothetical protein